MLSLSFCCPNCLDLATDILSTLVPISFWLALIFLWALPIFWYYIIFQAHLVFFICSRPGVNHVFGSSVPAPPPSPNWRINILAFKCRLRIQTLLDVYLVDSLSLCDVWCRRSVSSKQEWGLVLGREMSWMSGEEFRIHESRAWGSLDRFWVEMWYA